MIPNGILMINKTMKKIILHTSRSSSPTDSYESPRGGMSRRDCVVDVKLKLSLVPQLGHTSVLLVSRPELYFRTCCSIMAMHCGHRKGLCLGPSRSPRISGCVARISSVHLISASGPPASTIDMPKPLIKADSLFSISRTSFSDSPGTPLMPRKRGSGAGMILVSAI